MQRRTVQRTAIENVFEAEHRPLTIEDILTAGRSEVPSLNQATVYRQLKEMVSEGLLIRIRHPHLGALYEKNSRSNHHIFHCKGCDQIFELPGCPLDAKKLDGYGFAAEGHRLFLWGTCPKCADKPT